MVRTLAYILLKTCYGLGLKDKHISTAWFLPSRRQVIGVVPIGHCTLDIPEKHFHK